MVVILQPGIKYSWKLWYVLFYVMYFNLFMKYKVCGMDLG